MPLVWVGLGSGLGGIARFLLSGWIAESRGSTFPWGTLVVNATGSFLIGLCEALSVPEGRFYLPPTARQFLMVGVMGGYTTFSSFSLQTLKLAQEGQWLAAGGNVMLSVVLCLVGVWLGFLAGNLVTR